MRAMLHVVEPTLESYSGHCHSLVSSLCRAAADRPIQLWAGNGSEHMDFGPRVTVHPYFGRRIRLLQSLVLFRRLLREPVPLVVPTARTTDLALLHLAARGRIEPNRVFLYFHWVRERPDKLRFLRRIAARQPNLVILGTTGSVAEVFRRCGFVDVAVLPYPAPQAADNGAATPFRRLLYAGAARQDKGFGKVVDFVGHLAAKGETIPIAIQVSADHYGKYDEATRSDLARLRAIDYPPLELIGQTLSPDDYASMFAGGVCVQLYDRADFSDRVSGVTLDALARGCPVIATSGTWMAKLVAPSGAGLALDDATGESMHRAVRTIIDDYPEFRDRAYAAGRAQAQRSWDALLERLERS